MRGNTHDEQLESLLTLELAPTVLRNFFKLSNFEATRWELVRQLLFPRRSRAHALARLRAAPSQPAFPALCHELNTLRLAVLVRRIDGGGLAIHYCLFCESSGVLLSRGLPLADLEVV